MQLPPMLPVLDGLPDAVKGAVLLSWQFAHTFTAELQGQCAGFSPPSLMALHAELLSPGAAAGASGGALGKLHMAIVRLLIAREEASLAELERKRKEKEESAATAAVSARTEAEPPGSAVELWSRLHDDGLVRKLNDVGALIDELSWPEVLRQLINHWRAQTEDEVVASWSDQWREEGGRVAEGTEQLGQKSVERQIAERLSVHEAAELGEDLVELGRRLAHEEYHTMPVELRASAMGQLCERAVGAVLFALSEYKPKDASPSEAWLSNRDSAAAAASLVQRVIALEKVERADEKAAAAAARARKRAAKEQQESLKKAAEAAKAARTAAWRHKVECADRVAEMEQARDKAVLLGHGLQEAKADVADAVADRVAATEAYEAAKEEHKRAEAEMRASQAAAAGKAPAAPAAAPAAAAAGSAAEQPGTTGPPSMRKHVSRRKLQAEAQEKSTVESKVQARHELLERKQRLEQQLRLQAPIWGREEPVGVKNLYWMLPIDGGWACPSSSTPTAGSAAPAANADALGSSRSWVPQGAAMLLVERTRVQEAAAQAVETASSAALEGSTWGQVDSLIELKSAIRHSSDEGDKQLHRVICSRGLQLASLASQRELPEGFVAASTEWLGARVRVLAEERQDDDEAERDFRDGSVVGWQPPAPDAAGVWLVAYDDPPPATNEGDCSQGAKANGESGSATDWARLDEPQLHAAIAAAKHGPLRQLRLWLRRLGNWCEELPPGGDREQWLDHLESASSAAEMKPLLQQLGATVTAEAALHEDAERVLKLNAWADKWKVRFEACETLAQLALRLMELEVCVVRRESEVGLEPGKAVEVRMRDEDDSRELEWLSGRVVAVFRDDSVRVQVFEEGRGTRLAGSWMEDFEDALTAKREREWRLPAARPPERASRGKTAALAAAGAGRRGGTGAAGRRTQRRSYKEVATGESASDEEGEEESFEGGESEEEAPPTIGDVVEVKVVVGGSRGKRKWVMAEVTRCFRGGAFEAAETALAAVVGSDDEAPEPNKIKYQLEQEGSTWRRPKSS